MRCPYCQQNIRVQGRFCPKCGQQIFGLPVRRESAEGAPPQTLPPQPPPPSQTPSPPPYRPFGGAAEPAEDDEIVIESEEPEEPLRPNPAAPAGVHAAAGEEVGKTCPYCRFPLKPGEQIIACPACRLPHHADCWSENQGCTTYGCRGVAQAPTPSYGSQPTPAPIPVVRPGGSMLGELGLNPQEMELEGRATTALIIAVLGLIICCLPGPGVIAIIMAAKVLMDANLRRLPARTARSKAIWAICLSALGIVLNILVLVTTAGRMGEMGP